MKDFGSRLRTLRADKPPRILIYGTPKVGKTTLASEFPNPIFIQIEDGENTNSSPKGWNREDISSFADVIGAMQWLYESDHGHQTLVVDSLTELQKLIFDETCLRGDETGQVKSRIEDFAYGKGYVNALSVWQDFIDMINCIRVDRNMTVVLIAHARVDRFDDPETVSYHRYEIDLHDSAKASAMKLIEKEMDAILLVKKDVIVKEEKLGPKSTRTHAEGNANRFIIAEGSPAYIAGSRLGIPAKTVYRPGQGYAALAPFLPGQPAAEPATAE